MLSSYLLLGFQLAVSVGFPMKTLYAFLVTPSYPHAQAIVASRLHYPNRIL